MDPLANRLLAAAASLLSSDPSVNRPQIEEELARIAADPSYLPSLLAALQTLSGLPPHLADFLLLRLSQAANPLPSEPETAKFLLFNALRFLHNCQLTGRQQAILEGMVGSLLELPAAQKISASVKACRAAFLEHLKHLVSIESPEVFGGPFESRPWLAGLGSLYRRSIDMAIVCSVEFTAEFLERVFRQSVQPMIRELEGRPAPPQLDRHLAFLTTFGQSLSRYLKSLLRTDVSRAKVKGFLEALVPAAMALFQTRVAALTPSPASFLLSPTATPEIDSKLASLHHRALESMETAARLSLRLANDPSMLVFEQSPAFTALSALLGLTVSSYRGRGLADLPLPKPTKSVLKLLLFLSSCAAFEDFFWTQKEALLRDLLLPLFALTSEALRDSVDNPVEFVRETWNLVFEQPQPKSLKQLSAALLRNMMSKVSGFATLMGSFLAELAASQGPATAANQRALNWLFLMPALTAGNVRARPDLSLLVGRIVSQSAAAVMSDSAPEVVKSRFMTLVLANLTGLFDLGSETGREGFYGFCQWLLAETGRAGVAGLTAAKCLGSIVKSKKFGGPLVDRLAGPLIEFAASGSLEAAKLDFLASLRGILGSHPQKAAGFHPQLLRLSLGCLGRCRKSSAGSSSAENALIDQCFSFVETVARLPEFVERNWEALENALADLFLSDQFELSLWTDNVVSLLSVCCETSKSLGTRRFEVFGRALAIFQSCPKEAFQLVNLLLCCHSDELTASHVAAILATVETVTGQPTAKDLGEARAAAHLLLQVTVQCWGNRADEAVAERATRVFERALSGGRQWTMSLDGVDKAVGLALSMTLCLPRPMTRSLATKETIGRLSQLAQNNLGAFVTKYEVKLLCIGFIGLVSEALAQGFEGVVSEVLGWLIPFMKLQQVRPLAQLIATFDRTLTDYEGRIVDDYQELTDELRLAGEEDEWGFDPTVDTSEGEEGHGVTKRKLALVERLKSPISEVDEYEQLRSLFLANAPLLEPLVSKNKGLGAMANELLSRVWTVAVGKERKRAVRSIVRVKEG